MRLREKRYRSEKNSIYLTAIVRRFIVQTYLEKYSRGLRGAPAKGVCRESGARVQIPLSPLKEMKWTDQKLSIGFVSFFCPLKSHAAKLLKNFLKNN